ncbi:MAG TPA: glycosyltransferase family 1 protein [Xanthobacteraceae bacterium]|nr:glycosyltransferase family 1 protein [Xanthobacteraceae bacterium]
MKLGVAEGGGRRPPTAWFEVEDFLRYFDHFRNPTGLQRVPFEIYAAAARLFGESGRVRFCRLSVYTREFQAIGFDAIAAAYAHPLGARAPWRAIWEPARLWNELGSQLPVILRNPGFFSSLLATAARDFIRKRGLRHKFEHSLQDGDIIVSLGAGWGFPDYMKHIAAAKKRYGIRFAVLIYDLIPLENEAFVEAQHVVGFKSWLEQALPVADVVLTISQYSREALLAWAAQRGWKLPQVAVMRLGSGLSKSDSTMPAELASLKLPSRYVLFVSTIEIRKNHRLLVRLWRRLLERHGAAAVPVLVFAGQIGWKVDDLLAELEATRYLDGKIMLMPGLSETELRQAYRSCSFTVFPSLAEGWGLPVAESLIHGKFCVASSRTSIPEVAGDLIDYFDPADEDDALVKIERVLFEPGYLAVAEARLKSEYRPRTWAECVEVLLAEL